MWCLLSFNFNFSNGIEPNLQEKMGFLINRDSWGHLYSNDRGEILGPFEDKLLRKHLPRMFSLISYQGVSSFVNHLHQNKVQN